MKRNSRLSVALHVLVHLAEKSDPVTSEELSHCVDTNPVVIRRTLAGLRQSGLVTSAGGHGGGWRLARSAEDISLAEICAGLGERLLFAVDIGAPSGCAVQASVHGILDGFIVDAEKVLQESLSRISLASVSAEAHRIGVRQPSGTKAKK
jgi:Rrf2 family protein